MKHGIGSDKPSKINHKARLAGKDNHSHLAFRYLIKQVYQVLTSSNCDEIQCNKPLIRANRILSDPAAEGRTFCKVQEWERESCLSFLNIGTFAIVSIRWLYPNTIAKYTVHRQRFSNRIHDTSILGYSILWGPQIKILDLFIG